MKSYLILILLPLFSLVHLNAQKTYTENAGEFIFSFSDVDFQGENLPTKMRFTMFLHFGKQWHHDFNNNLGFYSGIGMRNIGFRADYGNAIEKRRTYALGVPAAFKIGIFDNHLYFYGGGEYELFFHYKQKLKTSNSKLKYSEWFSSRTDRFMPSLFCGMQFPGGVNLKVKYYRNDFLNKNFRGRDFGELVEYADFGKTEIFYIALSFNFKTKDLKKLYNPDSKEVRFAEFRK